MKVDALVAEIGSTVTLVSAFRGLNTTNPVFLGQGAAPTSIQEGDVRFGLRKAIENLTEVFSRKNLHEWKKGETLEHELFLAASSAAGGLRMTVHGLVYDMTVRAAREAALGAGANLKMVTAGELRQSDLTKLLEIKPNIIMIAGGTDYGERKTALNNSERIKTALTGSGLTTPVIYAGNIENRTEIRNIFSGYKGKLSIVENVYPEVDTLKAGEARREIQKIFEEHITEAPGMESIREMVDGAIIPTPGGVMLAAELLYSRWGDLLVIDVGGATTDVHSVTGGSEEVRRIMISPEPLSKRTVEGDLGVYINRMNVLETALKNSFPFQTAARNPAGRFPPDSVSRAEYEQELTDRVKQLPPVPSNPEQTVLADNLTEAAAAAALERHAGRYRESFGPKGRTTLAEGRDLTAVKYCIGTGGALTRLPGGRDILKRIIKTRDRNRLYPGPDTEIYLDSTYTMAALGVLSVHEPESALKLISRSIGMEKS